jgi:hypothetical protein
MISKTKNILSPGANFEDSDFPLHDAAIRNDVDALRQLLQMGYNIDAKKEVRVVSNILEIIIYSMVYQSMVVYDFTVADSHATSE